MMRIKPVLRVLASIGALLPAACTQYLDRKETVALTAGTAVESNMATHVIDPWPAHARNTRIVSDGERMQKAVERYRQNRVTDPGCAQPSAQGPGAGLSGGSAPASSGGTPCAQPAPQSEPAAQSQTGAPAAPEGPSGGGTR